MSMNRQPARDVNDLQRLVNRELDDLQRRLARTPELDRDGNLDLKGARVTNLGLPQNPTDAAPLSHAERRAGQGAGSSSGNTRTSTTLIDVGPSPSRIGAVTLDAVDYSDPLNPLITGSAALPSTMNDFAGCSTYLVVGSERFAGPFLPYVDGATFTFAFNYPRPLADVTYTIYFNERAAGGVEPAYDEATMRSASLTITARPSSGSYTPPPEALLTEWAVTNPSGVDLGVFGGRWLMKLDNFTFSGIPSTADMAKCYYYPSSSAPANPGDWILCAIHDKTTGVTNATQQFDWPDGATYRVCVRYRTYGDEAFPTASTPSRTITIPAHSAPPNNCVTWGAGGDISVVEYSRAGMKMGRYRFSPTINWGESLLAFVSVERRFRSPGFTDPSSAWEEIWFAKKGDPSEWGQEEVHGWPWTDDATYQEFRYVAVGHDTSMRVVQTGGTIQQTVDPSGNLIFTSIGAGLQVQGETLTVKTGAGLTTRGTEIVSLSRDLKNGDFEDGSAGWILGSSTSVVSGAGVGGSKALRVTAVSGGNPSAYQTMTARPGDVRRVRVTARNVTNGSAVIRVGYYDVNFLLLAYVDVSVVGSAYAAYQAVTLPAPAGTAHRIVQAIVFTPASTGYADYDNWEDAPDQEFTGGLGRDTQNRPILANGGVSLEKFGANLEPVQAVTAIPSAYIGVGTVRHTTTGKLYRWNGMAYVEIINAPDIKANLTGANALTVAQMAASLSVPQVVSSLPATNIGEMVTYLGQLYRWKTSSYQKVINAGDVKAELVTDKLTAATIAAGAIATDQLAGNEILVGGGSGKPPRFKVVLADGVTEMGFIGDRGDGFVGAWFQRLRVSATYGGTSRIESSVFGVAIENVPFVITGGSQTVRLDSTDGLRVASTAFGDSRESYFNSGQFRQRATQFSADTTRITHGDVALGQFDGLNYPLRLLGGADNYLRAQGGGGVSAIGYLAGQHVISTTGQYQSSGTKIAEGGRILFRSGDFVSGSFTRDTWQDYCLIVDSSGYVRKIPCF